MVTTLPRLLVLTDRRQARHPLVQTIERVVAGGARVIVLREKDLEKTERDGLADRLWQVLAPVDGTLIAASRPAGPARGVHLAAGDLPARAGIVGRSCHDAAEVRAAGAVDYVTVSPVFPTASKPGYGPALGLGGLRDLCRVTDVPVYALGGVAPANAAACLDAGARGVAVMGEVMRADDPAATVASLLKQIAKEVPA
ncbi:MAG: thiamine phosphate synthase [Micromonosporaceae bacterium]|nr:thiamine phosphate synthase [Micromonosporaceae bacterium]